MQKQGIFIQNLLRTKGIKQEDLAKELGVSKTYLSRAINQEPVPKSLVQKIADVIGVEVKELEPSEGGANGRVYTDKQMADMEEKVRKLELEITRLKAELYDQITKSKEK